MHDWHTFDVELGYDARQDAPDRYTIRDRDGNETELTAAEFEQLRAPGPNPQGLR